MTWFPIASSADLAYRTVYPAQILGHEFVAWRADDDTVNVWENRCLHRGVRLTRGINDGAELVCQYHGWRYANRTAGCTYIPAHPADAPARTICNRTYPVEERYGLVWASTDGDGEVPLVDALASDALALRAIPVNAPSAMVLDGLIQAAPGWGSHREDRDEHSIHLKSAGGEQLHIWVQPVDAHRSVIRGVLGAAPTGDERLTTLRLHNKRFSQVRAAVESLASTLPMPEPLDVEIVPVSVELSGMPELSSGRDAALRVQVSRKWPAADGIVGLELTSIADQLPTFQPGAHIDVHLPSGLVRQYSLTNGPGELGSYRIGVKLEPESTGGSQALHDTVRQGDVLAISAPRNNFSLRRDSERTVLIAGGIGLTPLLAMAQALDRGGLNYELHLFARGEDFLPFAEVRESLGDHVTEHLGLTPEATGQAIRQALGAHTESAQMYVCGPGPMIQAATEIALDAGWPDDSIHFEYFANTTEIDDSSTFQVALARSATTFTVAAGTSILDELRNQGVNMASSCEQGACGTCVATVLEGDVLHQDVYLSQAEHEQGDRMMTCVSRATSDRLVLDL